MPWIWQQKMKSVAFTCAYAGNSTLLLPYYALWNLQAKPVSRCQRKLKSLLNDQTDMFDSVSEKKRFY